MAYAQVEEPLSVPMYRLGPADYKGYMYTDWVKYPIAPNWTPDPAKIGFKKIEVDSFKYYVDERYFDSCFAYYNSSNFEKLIYKYSDSIATQYQSDLEAFCKLFRKVHGVVVGQTPVKKEVLFWGDSIFRAAILTSRVSFNSVSGLLRAALNITNREHPLLLSVYFTPYDYNDIPFFDNISNLTVEYIKAKNFASLKKDCSENFQGRIVNEKKFTNRLAELNLDSLAQFTSSLRMEGNTIVARVVYDMPKMNEYLILDYINEEQKFKLHDIGFVDKKKD